MKKSNLIKVINGVSWITLNDGSRLPIPTTAQIERTYIEKTEFTSFEEYVGFMLLKWSYLATKQVLDRKLSLIGSDFYLKLDNALYINYIRDRVPDGYCEATADLINTRNILNKEYAKTHDETIKQIRDRVSTQIDGLNDRFINGDDGNGDGHDLTTTAYLVFQEYYNQNIMPWDLVSVKTKHGTKKITVKTLAMRAVDNYISALKRNFTAMENNDDGNDDDGNDDRKTALETVAYFENFDIDSLGDFFKEHNITDKTDKQIFEYLSVGYNQKEIANKIGVSETTVCRRIAKYKIN